MQEHFIYISIISPLTHDHFFYNYHYIYTYMYITYREIQSIEFCLSLFLETLIYTESAQLQGLPGAILIVCPLAS